MTPLITSVSVFTKFLSIKKCAENINDQIGIQISTTSAMDQTIFDAMSKVIQKRIPEQAQLEKWLNLMIKYGSRIFNRRRFIRLLLLLLIYFSFSNANVAKAYLMDVRTKLFIATDSSPAENTQLSIYEICSGMIEMVDGISNVYEGAR